MNLNILVTGSNGQLGNCFRELETNYPQYNFIFTDIGELDITKEDDVRKFITHKKIQCIVNAAAYTAVDKAEEEPEKANLINGEAPAILARSIKDVNGLLVHISTDYIFNGRAHQPINEGEMPAPVSAYAHSKWLGEKLILAENCKSVILRTSWLYSEHGHNFVKSMMRFGKERDELKVVFDQVGTPTYAADLAKTILDLLPNWVNLEHSDIYHFSNEGVASWYDFAIAIHEFAGITCNVFPIETKDYPLPAKRPFYSLMNKEKIKKQFGIDIPHWRNSLKLCVRNILKQEM
ncbi:MAG: dTDP-4-dehydrorhamnose reductase [Bacteroidetes bacterium 4484_276]|nr:MAG: dTDP-4-dehydrorhamnose reductase [Bacteroidetes bacterium 4484_276]